MSYLLVGIDTEGDNQWDAAARANQRFENIYALPRLHGVFARHGIRPTYVITYPVATDERSARVLRELKAAGDCEIGAHHHAWETPPCAAEDVPRHLYASELPLGQFAGLEPVELLGQVPFPLIGGDPYPVTLSPHAFYWFQLRVPPDTRLSAST